MTLDPWRAVHGTCRTRVPRSVPAIRSRFKLQVLQQNFCSLSSFFLSLSIFGRLPIPLVQTSERTSIRK
jgi:hypothetical protein